MAPGYSPTFLLDAARPGQQGAPREARGPRGRTRDAAVTRQLPDSAKVTLSQPAPAPSLPERPLLSRDGLPAPSGSGLGVQLGGRGGKVDRGEEAEPGEGREAGPT